MGACTSKRQKTTETTASDFHDPVERILLVGPRGAGKSTIRKQLRLLYSTPFTSGEKMAWKSIIYDNALQAMQTAVAMSGATDIPAGAMLMERNAEGGSASLSIATAFGAAEQTKLLILRGLLIEERNIGAGGASTPLHAFLAASEGPLAPLGRVVAFMRIPSTTALIKSLLAEPVIQSIFEVARHHFDGSDYFLEKFGMIAADDYSPDAEDIVRARAPRSFDDCFVEGAGAAGGTPANLSDMPGMPGSCGCGGRLNWKMQGVDCILYEAANNAEVDRVLASLPHSCSISNVIFVADLSAYDKKGEEANLMVETLGFFEEICVRISKASSGSKLGSLSRARGLSSWMDDGEPHWVPANIHLFLNKLDLFEFAITKKDIRQPRERLFMDFRSNHDNKLEYFTRKFSECEERTGGIDNLYTHSLCATEIKHVHRVFRNFFEAVSILLTVITFCPNSAHNVTPPPNPLTYFYLMYRSPISCWSAILGSGALSYRRAQWDHLT